MKALYFEGHGGPDVLRFGEFADPVAGPGEAVVRVRACALNRLDVFVRQGWPGLKLEMPHIGGADVAGVVEAYGEGAQGPPPGSRVVLDPGLIDAEDEWTRRGEESVSPAYGILGENRRGGFAQLVAVPACNLLPLPEGVAFADAASLILTSLTAWRMLVVRAKLQPGETVAVIGAGGGVNSVSIQLARHLGATVIAVTHGEERMQRALDLGANHVIDRETEDWSKAVFTLTGRRGADVVVDNVGSATLNQSLRAACRGGRVVVVGSTSGPQAQIDVRLVFAKQLSILGSTMGSHEDFRQVTRLVFDGSLKPVVDSVFPLSEGRHAYERLESGAAFGKVVIQP